MAGKPCAKAVNRQAKDNDGIRMKAAIRAAALGKANPELGLTAGLCIALIAGQLTRS